MKKKYLKIVTAMALSGLLLFGCGGAAEPGGSEVESSGAAGPGGEMENGGAAGDKEGEAENGGAMPADGDEVKNGIDAADGKAGADNNGTVTPGAYTFEESVMGGAFKVVWTLELKEDNTYILTEGNEAMGETVYEGTYTVEDGIVVTGPFEQDPPQAAFFEKDKSCKWRLEGETCTPVNYSAGEDAGMKMGSKKESDSEDPLSNVAYAGGSPAQVCDIHLPKGDGPFPVIVLSHGGGFLFGDQNMELIQPVIQAGTAKGYAVVSIDYRKSVETVFPGALADVKAAVRFVRANAEEYGFDAEHIAVWGESAGAYLSLMAALTPEVKELNGDVSEHGDVSSAVTALVDFYGPVEFYTMDDGYKSLGKEDSAFSTNESFESKFLGQAIGDDKETTYKTYWETYKDQLPEDYALKAWIQVGNADESVPYTQSENFAERLGGVIGEENVEFSVIEGAGHEDAQFYTDENLGKVFEFLDGAMK